MAGAPANDLRSLRRAERIPLAAGRGAAGEGAQALRERNGSQAEPLLLQALELEPHPDYFFGRIGMAGLYLKERDVGKAEELLASLWPRKRFHRTEILALCHLQVMLCLQQDRPDSAESWLRLWASVQPDDPRLLDWQKRLQPEEGRPSWWGRLPSR